MAGGLDELTSLFHRSMKASPPPPPPPPPLSWPWPSCKTQQPSRKDKHDDQKDTIDNHDSLSDSCFSNSSAAEESESLSTTASEASAVDDAAAEALIRGLRTTSSTSDRLFYEPAGSTSSILVVPPETTVMTGGGGLGFDGGVAMAVESKDPSRDFKESMEEMVMAHGVKSWEWLEEMLGWYLRLNEKSSHGFIVGAFLDLLLGLAASPPPSSSSADSSSSTSSSSLSNSSFGMEIKEESDDHPHKT